MFGSSLLRLWHHSLGPLALWQWVGAVAAVTLGMLVGRILASLLRRLALRVVQRTPSLLDNVVVDAVHGPVRVLCGLVFVYLATLPLELPAAFADLYATLTRATAIAVVGWGLIRALNAVAHAVADGTVARETTDPVRLTRARSLRTQVIVANRVISVLIFVIGTACVALQFQVVRSVGMSLLASAGVAGVVLGFAAQKSLGALLAGIQLSLSQPIRIGDAVVIEKEFGTIEDIGLTYVAVRLWDERRLIVPTPRFLDQPFQNWSRTTTGLIGSVMLRVDFDLPVSALRTELERLIVEEPLWDKRVVNVQVTDAGEKSLELRVLVSARTPPALWDLRTSVREKLVTWLQKQAKGSYMPHARVLTASGGHEAPSDGRASAIQA
jgi:small-conductance mechanosensitive channel